MTIKTGEEQNKIFDSFMKANFYVNLKYEDPEIKVYYNTISYDILSCLKSEKNTNTTKINSFSDFMVILSDSNERIEVQNEKVGIIYIDQTGKNLKDSIIIAKLPTLLDADLQKRQEFASQYNNVDIATPFWKNNDASSKDINNIGELDIKNLEKGKKLLESAIANYCKSNSVPREQITNLDSFMDHLLPDIFKYKISVTDEQEIHQEIKNIEKTYPEVFLKSLHKMGYLE